MKLLKRLAILLVLLPTAASAQETSQAETIAVEKMEQLKGSDRAKAKAAMIWLRANTELDLLLLDRLGKEVHEGSAVATSYGVVLERLTDDQLISHASRASANEGSILANELVRRAFKQPKRYAVENASSKNQSKISPDTAYQLTLALCQDPGNPSLDKLKTLRQLRYKTDVKLNPREVEVLFSALPEAEIVRVKLNESMQTIAIRHLKLALADKELSAKQIDNIQSRVMKGLDSSDAEMRIGCLHTYFGTEHSKSGLSWVIEKFEKELNPKVRKCFAEVLGEAQTDFELVAETLMRMAAEEDSIGSVAVFSLHLVGPKASPETQLRVIDLAVQHMESHLEHLESSAPQSNQSEQYEIANRARVAQATASIVASNLEQKRLDPVLKQWIAQLDKPNRQSNYLEMIARCRSKAVAAAPKMESMLSELDDLNAQLKLAKQIAVIDSRSKGALNVAKVAIQDSDKNKQRSGLRLAATLGIDSEPLLPLIVAYLECEESERKSEAFYVLGRMQQAAVPAVPTIAAFLGKGNQKEELAAIRTIAKLGPHAVSAVPELRTVLTRQRDKDERVKRNAIRALVAMGPDAAAIDALTVMSESETEWLAEAATQALIQIRAKK